MFGKRKEDRRHRYAEEGSDDRPDADAPQEPELDPELAAALRELSLNRDAPLRDPDPDPEPAGDVTMAGEPDEPGQEDTPDQSVESSESIEDRDARGSAEPDAPSLPSWAGVQTAAMLAEPEDAKPQPSSVGEALPPPSPDQVKAAEQERNKTVEHKSALQRAQDRVASQKAELKEARSSSPEAAAGDLQATTRRAGKPEQSDEIRAAVERAEAAERSARELESTVSALKAELEQARAEATAAGVALERVEREAKEQVGGAARSSAQADAAQADSLRLASDLATNLQRQEAMIAALAGLQAEVTEQRAWFEAQIANRSEAESQQASVIAALEAAVRERDIELEALRQHLLEAEAKRAEEAAAFVAALERQ